MTELTGMTPQELSDWCKAQGLSLIHISEPTRH